MTLNSFINFYQKYDVVPVVDALSDDLIKKREALFYHLGLVPSFVKDRSVIEFGPGNGIHALYTQSLNPSKHVLVDGNLKSVNNSKENFKKYYPNDRNYDVVHCLIEEYPVSELADLIICEGVIPHQKNPSKLAKIAGQHIKKGGLFIFTCHDYISTFSETLRAFLGYLLTQNIESFEQKVSFLSEYFKDHFKVLKCMDRKPSDWVIDNIINENCWKSTKWFSIKDAIQALKNDFYLYRSSPSFITDWSWYKDLDGDNLEYFNERSEKAYEENIHNFLDFRFTHKARSQYENLKLLNLAKQIKLLITKYTKDNNDTIKVIVDLLQQFAQNVSSFSLETSKSILSYSNALIAYTKNKKIPDLQEFKDWWGRGNQIVSFLKIK